MDIEFLSQLDKIKEEVETNLYTPDGINYKADAAFQLHKLKDLIADDLCNFENFKCYMQLISFFMEQYVKLDQISNNFTIIEVILELALKFKEHFVDFIPFLLPILMECLLHKTLLIRKKSFDCLIIIASVCPSSRLVPIFCEIVKMKNAYGEYCGAKLLDLAINSFDIEILKHHSALLETFISYGLQYTYYDTNIIFQNMAYAFLLRIPNDDSLIYKVLPLEIKLRIDNQSTETIEFPNYPHLDLSIFPEGVPKPQDLDPLLNPGKEDINELNFLGNAQENNQSSVFDDSSFFPLTEPSIEIHPNNHEDNILKEMTDTNFNSNNQNILISDQNKNFNNKIESNKGDDFAMDHQPLSKDLVEDDKKEADSNFLGIGTRISKFSQLIGLPKLAYEEDNELVEASSQKSIDQSEKTSPKEDPLLKYHIVSKNFNKPEVINEVILQPNNGIEQNEVSNERSQNGLDEAAEDKQNSGEPVSNLEHEEVDSNTKRKDINIADLSAIDIDTTINYYSIGNNYPPLSAPPTYKLPLENTSSKWLGFNLVQVIEATKDEHGFVEKPSLFYNPLVFEDPFNNYISPDVNELNELKKSSSSMIDDDDIDSNDEFIEVNIRDRIKRIRHLYKKFKKNDEEEIKEREENKEKEEEENKNEGNEEKEEKEERGKNEENEESEKKE